MPQTFNVGARSKFVTGIAWMFMILAASMGASALLPHLVATASASAVRSPWPGLTGVLMGNMPWVMAVVLLLALFTAGSAIGLLLRLDWARRMVIALLLLAIAANLLGLWLQQEVVLSVVHDTLSVATLPPPAMTVFGAFVTAARVLGVLMTLVGCSVLAWIIHRLMSTTVRQEFA
jgi:hypothetical protein